MDIFFRVLKSVKTSTFRRRDDLERTVLFRRLCNKYNYHIRIVTCFRTNTKNISWKMFYSSFRLYFFCPSVLAIQKTYRKNASDFCLEKQELQTSLEVSSKNFANNGLYWLQFLNLLRARTKHNFLFLSNFFAVLKYIYKYIQVCLLVYIICLIQISALATWISYVMS